jgi:hypothetical protein
MKTINWLTATWSGNKNKAHKQLCSTALSENSHFMFMEKNLITLLIIHVSEQSDIAKWNTHTAAYKPDMVGILQHGT